MRRSSLGTTAIWVGTKVGALGVIVAAIIMLGEYVDDGPDPLTRIK